MLESVKHPEQTKRLRPLQPQSPEERALAATMKDVKHVIVVMSGKGGVGKSSVAVNLAVGLAQQGFSVGLLDIDLHGPSVPRLLGMHGPLVADDAGTILPLIHESGIKVLSMEFVLPHEDTAILWRGPKKHAAIRQFLSEVAWGTLDVLIIDTPPGTGDEHLTLLHLVPDIACVVVTTPQEISLADVRKALDFLKQTSARVLGLVENMSGLACPHCGNEITIFKQGGGVALAQHEGLPFLGAIPLDPAAVVAADQGVPAVLLDHSSAGRAFVALAARVAEGLGTHE